MGLGKLPDEASFLVGQERRFTSVSDSPWGPGSRSILPRLQSPFQKIPKHLTCPASSYLLVHDPPTPHLELPVFLYSRLKTGTLSSSAMDSSEFLSGCEPSLWIHYNARQIAQMLSIIHNVRLLHLTVTAKQELKWTRHFSLVVAVMACHL